MKRASYAKQCIALLLLSWITGVAQLSGYGQDADAVEKKVNTILGARKKIAPEILKLPENRLVVERLRELGRPARGVGRARILLVDIGDAETIDIILKEYRGENSWSRTNALAVMKGSSQPKIIAAIGDDLNREESVKTKVYDDVGMEPQSVEAMQTIKAIIFNSSAFSDDVRHWATELKRHGYVRKEEQRNSLRVWWAENKDLLKAERYGEVKPPSGWKPSASVQPMPEPIGEKPEPSPPSTLEATPAPAPSIAGAQPLASKRSLLPTTIAISVLLAAGVAFAVRRKS